MIKKRLALSSLAAFMTLAAGLSACSGGKGASSASPSGEPGATAASTSASASTTPANTDKSGDAVTLRLLVVETGTKWNSYADNAVAQEIAKKVGVKIEYVEADDNKFNVLMAGGDLPDIVRADPSKYGQQLIQGNLVIPMDDLLTQYGKDITANVPTVVDYSKKNWSQNTGKLYFLPPQVQSKPATTSPTLAIGPAIRWDYYKEIGAPAIQSTDDMLNVLDQIVQKHPKTDEGKKIYGVSMWQDWGLWPYLYPFVYQTTQTGSNTETMVKGAAGKQFLNMLTDESSSYWTAMDFYNKANRRGLLDPDGLTMKYNDYNAKATAGQIILGPADWAMGDFNKKYAAEKKGYMVVPAGKLAWFGEVQPIGWTDKSYGISKSSKHADKAMQFLNYLYSYEGARTMYSGLQGVHWDMVDGKPVLKDSTIDLKNKGGADWDKTGIALDINLIGLGRNVIDPAANTPVDLFVSQDALAKGNNELQKDFSAFYGVTSPGQLFANLVNEGKLENFYTPYKNVSEDELIKYLTVVTPNLTDDLKKKDAQLKELGMRYAAKIILVKDDAAFVKMKAEAIAAFKKAGADDITKFYQDAYSAARKASGLND